MSHAAEDRANALLNAGRPVEALAAIEAVASAPDAEHSTLALYSKVLKVLNRMPESLAVRRRAAQRFPDSGVAWHNVASALLDLGASGEAAEACRKALARGLDAAETWLILGRALRDEARPEEALAAFDEVLRRRPGHAEALDDKSALIWTKHRDLARALAVYPDHPAFAVSVVAAHRRAGDLPRAIAILDDLARRSPGAAMPLQVLTSLALENGEVDRAVAAAEAALRIDPRDPTSQQTVAAAYLGAGRPVEALEIARRLCDDAPLNSSVQALRAVAARLAGAPDYEALYDYDAFVRPYDIAPPPGWTTQGAFLADLKAELDALHDAIRLSTEQSSRGGTQTQTDLRLETSPAILGFFEALDPLIRRYMADVGTGPDPLRARNTGDYSISGCWSIRLRSSGHHIDHLHPRGWLSSAFYVDVPDEVQTADDHQGWIQFGRPSLLSKPPLPPAHFERPLPGRLVLFPSYMWHGTMPFAADAQRMTIAFDVIPA